MQEMRGTNDKVNVLLVDDQPAKLLANEEILRSLGENLIKASSAREVTDATVAALTEAAFLRRAHSTEALRSLTACQPQSSSAHIKTT